VLKRNLIANFLGQGWVALMGLVFVPLYIKYIGIEAYGLIGIFALMQAWLAVLDMGMAPTLSREMGRFTGGGQSAQSIRDLLRSIECVAVLVAGLVALVTLMSSAWVANAWLKVEYLPSSTVVKSLSIMGVIIALHFLNGIYRSSLLGLQQQVQLNLIVAGMATLRGVGAIAVLAWYSPTVEAFFVWQLIITVVSLAMLMFTTYKQLPTIGRQGRFSLDSLKGIGRYAGGMFGITILSLLLTQVDKILLSKLLTLSDYGYYTLAALVAMGLRVLMSPIALAWYPRMSQLHAAGETGKLVETYHEGAQLLCVVMGTATIVLIMYTEPILQLWTQDAELVTACSELVKWLALGNLLNGLMTIPYYAQLAYGWTGYALRVNAVSVVLIIPAIYWAVPKFGALGAAYVWVGLNAGYILIGVHFMYRRILTTEKWRWYVQDVIRPLLLAVGMAVIISLVYPQPQTAWGEILQIATSTILILMAAVIGASRLHGKARAFYFSLQKIVFSGNL
jgi:O-antigen/teichoic acid export membrane protein